VATGATREEVEKQMHDAIAFHLEGLRLQGESVPVPLLGFDGFQRERYDRR
jgi:predicted RNase H-like HicB family nuclease